MRDELTDLEWRIIQPVLPTKSRGNQIVAPCL